jgi:hypothetical protein
MIRPFLFCGERGIRTPGALAGTTVFKTAAIDHSAISPCRKNINLYRIESIGRTIIVNPCQQAISVQKVEIKSTPDLLPIPTDIFLEIR